MRALIDADNVAIASAWSAENETVEIAMARSGQMVERILYDAGATEYELWLSGGNNFRYQVYPEYKANRLTMPRPKWEQEVKQYLVDQWQANRTDGIEADDMLGIRQWQLKPRFGSAMVKTEGTSYDTWEFGSESIICHLDKDMNQIAGHHYNWELVREGKVVREKQTYFVTPEDADYFFFYQLLVGDPTDNIKGIKGIGPKKAAGILHGCESNRERYEAVLERYSCEEELDMNAQCVYIHRKHNDSWRNLIEA